MAMSVHNTDQLLLYFCTFNILYVLLMEHLLQEYFGLELFVYFKFLKFLLFSELPACFLY